MLNHAYFGWSHNKMLSRFRCSRQVFSSVQRGFNTSGRRGAGVRWYRTISRDVVTGGVRNVPINGRLWWETKWWNHTHRDTHFKCDIYNCTHLYFSLGCIHTFLLILFYMYVSERIRWWAQRDVVSNWNMLPQLSHHSSCIGNLPLGIRHCVIYHQW